MIIINGAGSRLAAQFILGSPELEFIAISRGSCFDLPNVKSQSCKNNIELDVFLRSLDVSDIVWINFQTLKIDGLLVSLTPDQMRESIEVNFLRNFVAANALLPKMIRQKKGKFIFIDSVKAIIGDVGCVSYSASKGANRPLMQSIVMEYSRFNVTCNTIAIGFADTPMLQSINEGKRRQLLSAVPGKKMVDTKDLNSAIKFVLANDSLNGQVISLDGGLRNSGC